MNRNDFIQAIKVRIDELSPIQDGNMTSDGNEHIKPVELYINDVLNEACDAVCLAAPLNRLKKVTFSDSTKNTFRSVELENGIYYHTLDVSWETFVGNKQSIEALLDALEGDIHSLIVGIWDTATLFINIVQGNTNSIIFSINTSISTLNSIKSVLDSMFISTTQLDNHISQIQFRLNEITSLKTALTAAKTAEDVDTFIASANSIITKTTDTMSDLQSVLNYLNGLGPMPSIDTHRNTLNTQYTTLGNNKNTLNSHLDSIKADKQSIVEKERQKTAAIKELEYIESIEDTPLFLRIYNIRLSNWKRVVRHLSTTDEEYKMVRNVHTTAGQEYPKVFINGTILEMYGARIDGVTLAVGEYVSRIIPSDTDMAIDNLLADAICWRSALEVLSITGRTDAVKLASEYYQESIKKLGV